MAAVLCAGIPAFAGPVASIDLSQQAGTRGPWRFTASQAPDMPDPIGMEDKVPGAIRLCLSANGQRTCQGDLLRLLHIPPSDDDFSEPHFLNDARVVHPRDGESLLLVMASSLHSVNGDQRVALALLAYDRAQDTFALAYRKTTGRNNNQEIRYIDSGPLRGAVISAEPTENAPFGFWITVDRLSADRRYTQALRYRSATHYGDGNPLAVIDSEMPTIEQRLGLWHPGMRLPLPAGKCANPRLIHQELWC
jgi:hypothetical protein